MSASYTVKQVFLVKQSLSAFLFSFFAFHFTHSSLLNGYKIAQLYLLWSKMLLNIQFKEKMPKSWGDTVRAALLSFFNDL